MRVRSLRKRLAALVLGVIAAFSAGLPEHASAYVNWGTVLVPGCTWAGALCGAGDLNVYSNGDGNEDVWGTYGLQYECVELIQRYAHIAYGDPDNWHGNAYQFWNIGPTLSPTPFVQLPNGGATPPQFGDVIVFGNTSYDPYGHVAIVSGVQNGYVDIVEQNWDNANPTGTAQLPISGTTMPARWGLPIYGWLRPAGTGVNLGASGPGGYTLDGYGGIHPYGSALPVTQVVNWPGWDIARGIAHVPSPSTVSTVATGAPTTSGGTSTPAGYILDGFGGIHPFGGAAPVTATGYWPYWDIARGIAVRPDGQAGYVLDGYGALHPFAAAGVAMPPVPKTAYWPGWDIARGVVLRSDGVSGYTLDGFGGIHPFGGAPGLSNVTAYWPGWDIARGLSLRSDGVSGWVLDGFNGLHPFGGAPAVSSTGYFAGQDIARGIVTLDNGGGYSVTAWGKVREFGDAPGVSTSAMFDNPVARGLG